MKVRDVVSGLPVAPRRSQPPLHWRLWWLHFDISSSRNGKNLSICCCASTISSRAIESGDDKQNRSKLLRDSDTKNNVYCIVTSARIFDQCRGADWAEKNVLQQLTANSGPPWLTARFPAPIQPKGPSSCGVISRVVTNAAGHADRDLRMIPSRIASPSTNGPRLSTAEPRGGHWEGDLILCKRTRPVLVLHERKSRVTLAARLGGKTAAETISVMLPSLSTPCCEPCAP
jgi:hypothetical protein